MAKINLLPEVLDLALYAGDGVKLRLICKDGNGDPIDVNGTIRAQIRQTRPDTDPLVSFAVNAVDAYLGIIVISLTGAQTQSLLNGSATGKFAGVWDVEWDSSGEEPRTLVQGSVECVADVSR
jgi:hypothetical protein